jgi:hypothetical protein
MAKKTFQIAPKLAEDKKPLPIQEMSVAQIQQIARDGARLTVDRTRYTTDGEQGGGVEVSSAILEMAAPKMVQTKPPKVKKKPERPQGRPRREEKVVRVSSDLPEDLYKQMKTEINRNGYTMNGFLAKVLREYFERKA